MIAIDDLRRLDDLSEFLAEVLETAAEELEAAVEDAVSRSSGELRQIRNGAVRGSIGHSTISNVAVVGSDDPTAVAQELGTHNEPPRPFLAPVASKQGEHIVRSITTGLSDRLGARFD